MQEHVENIIDCYSAIEDNIREIRARETEPVKFLAAHPSTRAKILMELRHDLEDMLKSVKALETATPWHTN